jgi:hypothetical protein
VLAGIGGEGFGAGDDDLGAGFDEAELWVPELEFFVDVVDEGEEAFVGEGERHGDVVRFS